LYERFHQADAPETTRTPEPGKQYYFAKATQADGNLLRSAPVWVTVAADEE
jgi:hypothetical protein